MTERTWIREVLQFWCEQTPAEKWFKKDDAFDQTVRERFLPTLEQVECLSLSECVADANTALAAIIVLDQFPRNMFRGTPRAFATDAKALRVAEAAIARGYDAQVSGDIRLFFYLPLEHAENAASQAKCVELMGALPDPELVKWAEAHKEIIDRFGRFPHRNAILGRTSTPQELQFLQQPGSSF